MLCFLARSKRTKNQNLFARFVPRLRARSARSEGAVKKKQKKKDQKNSLSPQLGPVYATHSRAGTSSLTALAWLSRFGKFLPLPPAGFANLLASSATAAIGESRRSRAASTWSGAGAGEVSATCRKTASSALKARSSTSVRASSSGSPPEEEELAAARSLARAGETREAQSASGEDEEEEEEVEVAKLE